MKEQHPGEKPGAPINAIDTLHIGSSTLVACFAPIIMCHPGTHAYASAGPLAFILMFFWSALGNFPMLLFYLPVWLLAVIYRRITADRNEHSRYMGYLFIVLFLPISEGKAVALTALLMFGTGLYLYTQYPPLGVFVTAGGVALFIKEAIEREANNRRIRQMRDAQIDMRYLSRQFRK